MRKDTRPFNFTINAAEFFAEIESKSNKKDLVNWIEQFSKDLITLNPKTDYGQKVVQQTIDYIDKQSVNGSKGGRPRKTQIKAVVSSGLSQTEPKQKVKEKEKEVKDLKPSLSDFQLFWDAFGYKEGRGGAEKSWVSIRGYSPELFEKIINAAKRESKRRPQLLAQNKTPKMAQGWLTDRRWEDEQLTITTKTIQNADGYFIEVPI